MQHVIATYGYVAIFLLMVAFRGPTYIIAALVVIGLIVAICWYVRRHRADRAAGDRRPDAAGRQPDARARR